MSELLERVCMCYADCCGSAEEDPAVEAPRLAARLRLEVAREFVEAISVGPPDLAELPIVINAVLRDWERRAGEPRVSEAGDSAGSIVSVAALDAAGGN